MISKFSLCVIWWLFHLTACNQKIGPDPWDFDNDKGSPASENDYNTPPDLKIPLKKKIPSTVNSGTGDWFFKRTLAIILYGGHNQVNEDGSVDISLQMKFELNRWETLDQYIKSNVAFTDDMFRRSIGYVEDAIYKPTVTEKMVLAWNEYILYYLTEYKLYLTSVLGGFAIMGLLHWLWKRISHKHVLIILFIGLYIYEVIISYKEAEQKELETFMAAVDRCSWYFWRSSCDVPPPDPLIFMKHMNPLKICIRMFTTLLSEPMVSLSATVNTMVHSMTDGLWFPFDKIFHSLLILCINVLLIFILIMITFNFILNIPFNLSFLGLINFGVKQRHRNLNLIDERPNDGVRNNENNNIDRISGATLNRILDVYSRALDNSQSINRKNGNSSTDTSNNMLKIKRSASTSRLPTALESREIHHADNNSKRQKAMFMFGAGDGKISHNKL